MHTQRRKRGGLFLFFDKNFGMFHLSVYSLHTFKKFKKFLKCYQSIGYQCFKLRTDLLNFSNLVNLAKKV